MAHHFVLFCVRRRNRKKARVAPKATGKEDKCATRYCRNQKAKNPGGYFLEHCWKCRSRRLKLKCPVTYVLNMLRHSARKRKLPFTITKAQFSAFCAETGYLEKRGNKPENLTLDRVDPNRGYHIDNLRVLTHAENSKQGADNVRREDRGCEQSDDAPEWSVPVSDVGDESKSVYTLPDDQPF